MVFRKSRKENPSINLHDDGQVELVCQKVGQLIGRLHLNDMIHGDLTSSNIILTEVDTKKMKMQMPILVQFILNRR